jgi:hypothetical protein
LFSLNRVGHGDEHTGRRAEGDSRRSAGSVLRSQEGSGEDGAFALCARDFGDRLQCLLRTDPAPLGVWGVLRGIGPTLAEEALGADGAFALCARGFGVRFQGLLRTDPAPLAYVGGSAGTVLRSLRKLWEGWGFRALRGGLWCSLPRLAVDRSRSAVRMGAPRDRSCAR